MTNNFFAILDDDENSIRRIELTQELIPQIRQIFTKDGNRFIGADIQHTQFDGNYQPDLDEALFVEMATPPAPITEVATNTLSKRVLNLSTDEIKSLFWYENATRTYYLQTFDKRKLLSHKWVLFEDKKLFNRLQENAFIVDEHIDGVYRDGKFYFISAANANKIFSLTDYFKAANDHEIREFAKSSNIAIDAEWLVKRSNSAIKKQITQLTNSKILETTKVSDIQAQAETVAMQIEVGEDGKIVFPKDVKKCRALLSFLNEGRFTGPFSKNLFETNSKRIIKR